LSSAGVSRCPSWLYTSLVGGFPTIVIFLNERHSSLAVPRTPLLGCIFKGTVLWLCPWRGTADQLSTTSNYRTYPNSVEGDDRIDLLEVVTNIAEIEAQPH